MAFGDFFRKIGKLFKPPENIREWRQQKRQSRRYWEGLGQDASAVRSGVRAWMENNPRPKRTKGEKDKIYSEIPEIFEEGIQTFGKGQNSVTPTGGGTPTIGRQSVLAGINPLFYLLLIPIVFPKQFKKFFKF